jgi:hypothetical protein
MRRRDARLAAVCLLWSAALGGQAFAEAKPAAVPKAVATESTHDLGSTPPTGILRHTFEVRNEGTAPLVLDDPRGTVFTRGGEFDHTIAPGASGKVTIEVNPELMTGPSTGTLHVKTNDPSTPDLVLTLKLDVEPLLFMKPGYARWNTVQGEREGTISQLLFAKDGKEFKVLGVEAPPYIRTSFRPAAANELKAETKGSQWHIEATVDSWAPVGAITGYLRVNTDHPAQPVALIPISGFVRPILHVTPPTGTLGELHVPADGQLVVFELNNFATESIAVSTVESTLATTEVKLLPIKEGRHYRIELRLLPTMAAGPFQGVLRIHTDSPKLPLYEVPFSGSIVKDAPSASS